MTPPVLPAGVRQWMRMLFTLGLTLTVLATAAGAMAASSTPRVAVTDGTLQIAGGTQSERIVLRLAALDPTRLEVDFDDDGSAEQAFDVSTFRAINADGGPGNDSIRIDQVNGAFTTTEATRIDGGNGNDTLVGGAGAETFVGGNGDDFIDGNGGADRASLGRGDDVFVWDPGDASDVVDGNSGFDTMVFNGAGGDEIMAATASGDRVRFTRNLGTIVMDLDEIEAIDVRALGGADSVTVDDLAGTDLERVDLDLTATLGGTTPDGQADAVKIVATEGDDTIAVRTNAAAVEVAGLASRVRITGAESTLDTLVIDTLGGTDDVSVDPDVEDLILVTFQ
jgi:hypothetical protein